MIISHDYQFIFLKVRKTAGTSIEVFLSGVCGEGDIVTPISPVEKGHRPRNYDGFYNHISGTDIKCRVSEEVWNYYKFCVERNPWDKMLSHYYWNTCASSYTAEQFDEFLELCDQQSPFADYHYSSFSQYTDSDKNLLVDRVLRYESLNRDLSETFERLGIPFNGTLDVNAKGDQRTDRRHYRDVLLPRHAERIAEIFNREIALFGWTY